MDMDDSSNGQYIEDNRRPSTKVSGIKIVSIWWTYFRFVAILAQVLASRVRFSVEYEF